MSGRLAGKVAVITGTASGQGAVAARLFAAEGALVEGCDVRPGADRATVDLTDEGAVRGWLDDVGQRHGRIDVLYLNAGATRFSAVQDTTLVDWRFVLAHELDVVFLPAKHAWRWLLQSDAASVVLVGSTAGVSGSMTNQRLAHTVTKGGVVAATKQLAAEGAPHGIRVNCVSPGMIRTPATEADLLADDHPMHGIASHIPLGRVGQAEEVVRCALFLASDEASYVTGANLMVDGGWSAVLPGA
jgi:meso-butanediol dehydrogenase/(S,S)-butanediol dehydrogenase/diacetyl reductase